MYVLYVIRQGQFIHALKVLQSVQTPSLQEDTRICNWFYSTKEQDTAAMLLLRMRMRMCCGLVCGKSVKTQDECADGLRAAVVLMSDSRSGSFRIALSTPSFFVLRRTPAFCVLF